MTKKFIDANELNAKLDTMRIHNSEFATDDYIDGFADGVSAVMSEILNISTTDVQEVVRCKDCEYHNDCSIEFTGMFGLNSFCCRGIRKGENTNVRT